MTNRPTKLSSHIESWNRYGSYLTGITAIASVFGGLTFDELYAGIQQYGHTGGWSKEAIRNAFNKAREWEAFAPHC
jgi:hypothetical protein